MARPRGPEPAGAGEAHGVPRDHAERDPRSAREPARARHEARRSARRPAQARPHRRLGDVARAVARVRAWSGRVGRTRAERRRAHGRRARAGAHALPFGAVVRPRGNVPCRRRQFRCRGDATLPRLARRARRQAPRRGPRLRPRDRSDCDGARERRRPARRGTGRGSGQPAARRRLPRHQHRVRPLHREAARTLHHVDPAAGVGPQAPLHGFPHDGGGPTALRARVHHLHAYRQHEPVGAGRRRRPHRNS